MMMNSIIPISLFNKGQAGKIFTDVKNYGPKIVLKNNEPECILISPDNYNELINEIEDLKLMVEAAKRLENIDSSKRISQSDVDSEFGFDSIDLSDLDGIEFE